MPALSQKQTNMLCNQFTNTDHMIILEAARIALGDANMFDEIAQTLDIHDSQMLPVRDKLNAVMNNESWPSF